MLKRVLVLIFLALSGVAFAADRAAPGDKTTQQAVQVPDYGHLEYFGFYASAMGHWNFTGDLAPFTNLTWIHLGAASDPGAAIGDIVQRLEQAQDAGVQAVLSIEPFLFTDRKGSLRPDEETLDLLVELRARIEAGALFDAVAMIYPKDEPFREFIRYRDPGFWEQYVTGEAYAEIHADLVHANALVKTVFPEVPLGVILSGNELQHNFFSIPENYDWVGFDCYASMFRACESNTSMVDQYEQLLANMQAHQRLIAVPEVWAKNSKTGQADWPRVLSRRFSHHYEIALSEPRFIAFIPFIWSFEADGEVPGLGLDRFSGLYDTENDTPGTDFVNEVLNTGLQIKGRQFRYPNLSWAETEADSGRPLQNIRGGIESISPGGLLRAWAVDDALPHKNLRVQIRLRDTRGRLLHKSKVMRSHVLDHGLGVATTVGLHGVTYALPEVPLKRYHLRPLKVELLVFSDGGNAEVFHAETVTFRPGTDKPATPAVTSEKAFGEE